MQAAPSCASGRQAMAGTAAQCSSRSAGHTVSVARPNVRAGRRQQWPAVRAATAGSGSTKPAAAAVPGGAAARPAAGLSMTEEMLKQMEQNNAAGAQALGAGGATTYEALRRADAAWRDLRTRRVWGPRPEFVRTTGQKLEAAPEVDVAVCGGTLGIFLACSLQQRGLRVAVLERGPLQGRAQEWNISRKELAELVELGVLTEAEAEECISVEFNPVRVGFYTGDKPGSKKSSSKSSSSSGSSSSEVWTQDVLNLGVSPARLVAAARRRFEAAGGLVLERTPLSGVWVHPDGVCLQLGDGSDSSGGSAPARQQLTARLLLDSMGHASPIVQQVRWGQKPDGVCLVVGSCARGFDADANTTGDVIFTTSHSQPPAPASGSAAAAAAAQQGVFNTQLFWEAFPAGSGPSDRTTYLFTYIDAQPNRPSLEALMEEYWQQMPAYQGVQLADLQPQRILFGWFPTYRGSPLAPTHNRILQVGDASGIQSPLSFGGFGALTRHLGRLTDGVTEALGVDLLDSRNLALLNAYNPGLSGAWMLQKAMSIGADKRKYSQEFINRLLAENFQSMDRLGDATLKPFLQDVIQLKPLVQTLSKQMVSDPLMVPQILARVGPGAIADWMLHLLGLAAYTFLDWDAKKYIPIIEKLPPKQRFLMRRALENWRYGSGKDYRL